MKASVIGGLASLAVVATGVVATGTASAAITGHEIVNVLATAPATRQAFARATCPGTKYVVGGGALYGLAANVNLNSSYPSNDRKAWEVYVNNPTATAQNFKVYAVCADKPSSYKVVSGYGFSNGYSQDGASAWCPNDYAVVGGGVFSYADSTGVNINSSYPVKGNPGTGTPDGWGAYLNNATAMGQSFSVYAICAKNVSTYVASGTTRTTSKDTYGASGVATCNASGSIVLNGGAWVESMNTQVNLGSSAPLSNKTWWVHVNNGWGGENSTFTPIALCAYPATPLPR